MRFKLTITALFCLAVSVSFAQQDITYGYHHEYAKPFDENRKSTASVVVINYNDITEEELPLRLSEIINLSKVIVNFNDTSENGFAENEIFSLSDLASQLVSLNHTIDELWFQEVPENVLGQLLSEVRHKGSLKVIKLIITLQGTRLSGELDALPSLEDLLIQGTIEYIPESISMLSNLKTLSIQTISKDNIIPNSLFELESLKNLKLSFEGTSFSNEEVSNSQIENLRLSNATNKSYPILKHFKKIKTLSISGVNSTNVNDIKQLSLLEDLEIEVENLEEALLSIPSQSIKKINLTIKSLAKVTSKITTKSYPQLETVELWFDVNLDTIILNDDMFSNMPKLTNLRLYDAVSLVTLPMSLNKCHMLNAFSISEACNLKSIMPIVSSHITEISFEADDFVTCAYTSENIINEVNLCSNLKELRVILPILGPQSLFGVIKTDNLSYLVIFLATTDELLALEYSEEHLSNQIEYIGDDLENHLDSDKIELLISMPSRILH